MTEKQLRKIGSRRAAVARASKLLPEIMIDIFAGGSGEATGIRMATGRSPDVAINHSPEALAIHNANHPNSLQLCADVWKVDPRSVAAGRRVGLLWASPDCTFFSRAKSGKPLDKRARELAWGVTLWAKRKHPRVMIIENVPEFVDWCPLRKSDGRPIPERRGESFRRWVRELEREGYKVEWRVLSAHEYGASTTRRRFFAVARLDADPVWPDPDSSRSRPMSELIDWTQPMLSVYDRLAPKTIARIDKGIQVFVLQLQGPDFVRETETGLEAAFIVQHNLGQVGKPLTGMLPSITTRDSHGLVTVEMAPGHGPIQCKGKRYKVGEVRHRMLVPRELADAMGFPRDHVLVGNKGQQSAAIGDAVSPVVAEALVRANYRGRAAGQE